MITPENVYNDITTFQEANIEENNDHMLLSQSKKCLERKLVEQQYLCKQMQLMYTLLDKTRNFQEFTDVLMNSRNLLREIFTLEGHMKRSAHLSSVPRIDWEKYGIDITEYIAADDELLALYSDGYL
ncbi:ADA histone acetyltransferase complex component 2 [Nakaseomyces bracarensis]|uniref:ADA histone acetyltransferase complex component 2 n=1 Tax=Nakaseomyces bracarensis TaxID=273131 RepID=A0ABR4NT78_9SACH